MAAPIGNEFWKLRSKHGRDKIFATPEIMWEAACEYFEWAQENTLKEVAYLGKDADYRELPKMRAFSLEGLAGFLHVHTKYFAEFKSNLQPKISDSDKDFSDIITRIEDIIFQQQYEGAAAGFLNANIISRKLGLADKKDIDARVGPPERITGMTIK